MHTIDRRSLIGGALAIAAASCAALVARPTPIEATAALEVIPGGVALNYGASPGSGERVFVGFNAWAESHGFGVLPEAPEGACPPNAVPADAIPHSAHDYSEVIGFATRFADGGTELVPVVIRRTDTRP